MQDRIPPLHERIDSLFPQQILPDKTSAWNRTLHAAGTLGAGALTSALVVLAVLFPYRPGNALTWVELLLCALPVACAGLLMNAWLEQSDTPERIPLPLRLLLMAASAALLVIALALHRGTVLTHMPFPLKHW